jgi:hypothetical protein
MFTNDRDLLAIEPNLFRDVSFLAQTIAQTTGTLSAGTLTLDDPIPAGAVGAGDVAVVNRAPLEILEVTDTTTLVVSLTRPDVAGPQLIPADRTGATVTICSFAPQRALIHDQLLRMLGIEPDDASVTDVVTESRITNPRDLVLVECLGALHLIYAAASAPLAEDSPLAQRARMYQERFAKERSRARAKIDLDGDGQPDAERTFNVIRTTRG